MGHVNSGKLHPLVTWFSNSADKRTIEKFEREPQEIEKDSFKYTWVLDKLKAEENVALPSTLWKFETAKCHVNTLMHLAAEIHQEHDQRSPRVLLRLIVPFYCEDWGRWVWSWYLQNCQTCENSLLPFTLGVKQLVFGVNKMDSINLSSSETHYEEIKKGVSSHTKKIGHNSAGVTFVLISEWHRDNMLGLSDKIP